MKRNANNANKYLKKHHIAGPRKWPQPETHSAEILELVHIHFQVKVHAMV